MNMLATSQTILEYYVRDFQSFLLDAGVGLYPSSFNTTTWPHTIVYSTDTSLIDDPPIHASLYVPGLVHRLSPVRELFYTDGGGELGDAPEIQLALRMCDPFAAEYIRIQSMIDVASADQQKMRCSDMELLCKASSHVNGNKTEQDIIRSAIYLFSLKDKDNVESAANLFKASTLKATNKDGRALLMELAHAMYSNAYWKINEEDVKEKEKSYEAMLRIADKMTRAWSSALHARDRLDPACDPARICAGILSCFATHDNYDLMITFLERSQELYTEYGKPEIGTQDDLRMAWAKLACAEAVEDETEEDWGFAIDHIRDAVIAWQQDPSHEDHIEKLEGFLWSADAILKQLSEVN